MSVSTYEQQAKALVGPPVYLFLRTGILRRNRGQSICWAMKSELSKRVNDTESK